jgi:hypothetical protein
MSSLPPCSFCGEYQAVFTGTSFIDGDTVTPCGNCFPGFVISMAAAMITTMTEGELQEHIEALNSIVKVWESPQPAAKPSAKLKKPPAVKTEPAHEPPGSIPGDQSLLVACPECEAINVSGGLDEIQCDNCGRLFDPRELLAG